MLAGAWVLFEGFRGIILTGFPWNPIGNVWVVAPPVLQGAAWIGVYGLSLVTVFAASAPAVLSAPDSRHRHHVAMSGLLVVAVVAAFGFVRLRNPPLNRADAPLIRLIQPNIAQKEKWNSTKRAVNFARQLQLSTSTASAHPTHVVWPETAVSFKFLSDPAVQSLLRGIVPKTGYLLTGALRVDRVAGRAVRAYNSLVAIDGGGLPQTVYDKHHLVPFGEYVPFRSVLPVEKITPGAVDFSPGSGLRTLHLPGLPPFSPLICYEVIFPGRAALRRDRPEWLLNVTNDAWFGISAGPYQHFASAQMRAVEEGLPLVRVANTGVSGVIDPHGRVIASIELGRQGVVDVALPSPALPTPFALFGNAIPAALMMVLFFISMLTYKKETL
jgi:apolipoprotein N-acyltransferase